MDFLLIIVIILLLHVLFFNPPLSTVLVKEVLSFPEPLDKGTVCLFVKQPGVVR